ncbi:MAG: hypothetical protein AB7T06_09155 [Kofleriaceae bacterium]
MVIAVLGSAGCDSTDEPIVPVTVVCDTARDRFDPGAVRGLSNAELAGLGRARTGTSGRGTTRSTTHQRYVSAATGDDAADGSEATPWRTLQHAADSVEPDTTVFVDASGDYAGGLVIANGGEPDGYVIFTARDPASPPRVLGNSGETDVVRIEASYVVFQGFEIAHHQRASLDDDTIGIHVEPTNTDEITHVEIRNNIVHDIGPGQIESESCYYNGHGIIAEAEGARISNIVIDGNELYDLFVGNSEVLVLNGNVEGFCVTANYIHDVDNIAIDIIGYEKNAEETTRNGVVADNVVLDASNEWPYCTRGNCTYPAGDQSSDGIYVDGGAQLEIAYNVVGRADHGIELQSENGQLIRDVEVHHNAVFNSYYKHLTLGPNERCSEHDNELFDDPSLADATRASCQ